MEDLFNLNTDDFTGKSSSGSRRVDESMYNPGPDQGQNGIYKSVIRFIPWVGDPAKSKYKKYAAKLVNPLTNERLLVDCPSTNGASSILWSLDLELKKLKNEEPAIVEEIQKYFNRYYNYYSCVYVKKDPQFPNLEGQIKVYSYGYTIDNLIQQELNPESELVTTQKINPFSLTHGKDFVLVIKRKTKAWRDFSSSKFMSEVSPLIITHGEKEIPVSTDQKVMQFVTEFFKKNSPDLSQYFYKDWTDYEYEKVAEYIKAIVPYKQIIENLVNTTRDERMKKHFTNSKPVSRTVAPAGESLEFSPAPQTKSSSLSLEDDEMFSAPASKPAAKKQDDLDDLFADL
jgi:hypothetical protein